VDYKFWVTGLAYSPDGQVLAAGELEFLKLFDTESSSELAKVDASGSFEDFFTFTTDSKSLFMISAQLETVTIEWFGIP
jgi:WD40 repeat protein